MPRDPAERSGTDLRSARCFPANHATATRKDKGGNYGGQSESGGGRAEEFVNGGTGDSCLQSIVEAAEADEMEVAPVRCRQPCEKLLLPSFGRRLQALALNRFGGNGTRIADCGRTPFVAGDPAQQRFEGVLDLVPNGHFFDGELVAL